MMHIQRDARGDIIGLLQRPLTEPEAASGQWLPADPADPAVAIFARRLAEAADHNPLALTDAELARVTEDLIDVLIDRAVIQFTDLPVAAQNKLLQRRQTRARLANRLDLLGSDDII
ncbi:hypothetical protein [Hydrogenophaga atypica]|uniref:Tryptophan synthase subunit beta like protein n=1 Tax=Hydrogenophaga atypica TaxID=249409 RepID=A0ABW2QD21_9BURK